MTNEELRDALIRLSKLTGFSFEGIDYMARIIAQADYDPLPPEEWGAPFEFATHKVSAFDDEYDFDCFNAEVPRPNAQVDLRVAWQEYERDVKNIDCIYAAKPRLSIAKNWQLFMNQWDWVRFWSVRHPDAEAREMYRRSLRKADAAADRIADKAEARLRERGIQVHPVTQ
jgi:hypothetical protein